MNFIIAFVFTIIFFVLSAFAPSFLFALDGTVYVIFLNIILINISLGVFNLIPIPPLDGSKVLIHFLPYNAKQWFESKQYIYQNAQNKTPSVVQRLVSLNSKSHAKR